MKMEAWRALAQVAAWTIGAGVGWAAGDTPRSGAPRMTRFQLRRFSPDDLRWRDIADQPYSAHFRRSYHYQYELANLDLTWNQDGAVPGGRLVARRLKPNFAYQLKLMGSRGLYGPEARDNEWDPRAWASYQLGKHGRWWCEECDWNAYDGDVAWHIRRGHTVVGYIVFDWFVTDATGCADVSFTVESSYHVLWHTGQRKPGRYDSSLRRYYIEPGDYAYGPRAATSPRQVQLFAEWETGRPLPGQLQLPAGEYQVFLNLTEESFHASSGDGGGHWAQVLQAPVRFTVLPASPDEALPLWFALRLWLGQSWERTRTTLLAALRRQ